MAKGREWAREWVRAELGRILERLPEKARLPTSETLARQWRVRADIVAEVYAEVAAAGRAEFIEGVGYVKSSGSVVDVEEPDNAVRSVDLPDDRPESKLAAARAAILTQRTRAGLGAHLPTEWEIAEAAGVSRQTAREAFVELAEEGLVRKGAPGQGWLAVRSATSGTDLHLARSTVELKDRVRTYVVDAPPGTSVSARWVARTFRVSNRLADRAMRELAEEAQPQVEALQRGKGLEYRTVGGSPRAPTREAVEDRPREVPRSSRPPASPARADVKDRVRSVVVDTQVDTPMSTRTLAAQLGASEQSVNDAMRELAEERLPVVRGVDRGADVEWRRARIPFKDGVRALHRELPAGARLRLKPLAEYFGVPLTTARDQMSDLAEDGLVGSPGPGRGGMWVTFDESGEPGAPQASRRQLVKERLREIARSLPHDTHLPLDEMARRCDAPRLITRDALLELAAEPEPLFETRGQGGPPEKRGWRRTTNEPGEPTPPPARVSPDSSWADAVDDLTRRPADSAAKLPEWDDFGPPEASDVDEIADPGSKTRAPDRIEEPAEAIEEPAAHADEIEQRLGEPVTLDDPDDLDGPG